MSQYWSHKLSLSASGEKKNYYYFLILLLFLSNKNELEMLSNAWEVRWEIEDALPCSRTSSPLKKRYTSDAHAHVTRCWGTSILQVQSQHFSGIFPHFCRCSHSILVASSPANSSLVPALPGWGGGCEHEQHPQPTARGEGHGCTTHHKQFCLPGELIKLDCHHSEVWMNHN